MRRKMRSRRSSNSAQVTPPPSAKGMYGISPHWINGIMDSFTIITSSSPNLLWGFLILMAALASQSQAAPSHPQSPSSILSSLQHSPYRTVYPLLEMETRTWAYRMGEVEEAAYSIIDDACYYLAMADSQCSDHPSSCRTTLLSLENFKKAVSKAFDIVFSMQRMCDMGNQPSSE